MAGQPQTVKVQHGCGCTSAIGFLLVIGLIGLFIEDVGKHPGTWVPIFVIVAIAAAGAGWWYYSEQQKKPPPSPPADPPPPSVIQGTATPRPSTPAAALSIAPTTKACPDCAETVKAAARVCRFCGYRFEDDEFEEEPADAPDFEPTDDKSKYQCPECGAIFSDMNGYLWHAETHK